VPDVLFSTYILGQAELLTISVNVFPDLIISAQGSKPAMSSHLVKLKADSKRLAASFLAGSGGFECTPPVGARGGQDDI
jgi:hypothetical protein